MACLLPRHYLALTVFIFSTFQTNAKQLYLTQSGAGNGDGLSLKNAGSVTWFNTTANWGPGSKQISPGDTVCLTGTISSTLTIKTSGAVGRAITLLFGPGASMQSEAWPASTGAINLNSKSYITIDGGAEGGIGGINGSPRLTNGYIENTANGTALANKKPSIFIYGPDATDITVQNLALYNLYVRTSTNDLAPASFPARDWSAIAAFYNGRRSPHNWTVANCIIHDAYCGFLISYNASSSNMQYCHCTTYNCNWGGNAGDYGRQATLSDLAVHDNYFHDWANWDDTTGSNRFHHNGFYAWAVSGGTANSVSYYNNVIGPNFGGHASSGLFISGLVKTVLVYNNVFVENAHDRPMDGLLYLNPYPDITGTYMAYNNTFVGGGNGIGINFTRHIVGQHVTEVAQTIKLKNNLFVGLGTAIELFRESSSVTADIDYNLGYKLVPREEYSYSSTNSSIFKSFALWQRMGFDVHGTNGRPNLNGKYVPQYPSAAIGAGADLSDLGCLGTDMTGAARTRGTAWDIGAYEVGK